MPASPPTAASGSRGWWTTIDSWTAGRWASGKSGSKTITSSSSASASGRLSAGRGVLAFVTDHSYLDGPTFRGMRQNLQKSFDEIYILNLHGNAKRREAAPGGGADENIFAITQGAAIALFVKHGLPLSADRGVQYADAWGERPAKLTMLGTSDVGTTPWRQLAPAAPFYEFAPVDRQARDEYDEGWRVTDIFPVGSNGVQTSRDRLVVDFQEGVLLDRIEQFLAPGLSDAEVRARFFAAKSVGDYAPGDTRGWKLGEARQALRQDQQWRRAVERCQYRPFDARWLLYHGAMVDWPRTGVMRHLLQSNRALCVGRAGLVASGAWDLVFCSRQICDHNLFYRGSSVNFPLYLYANNETPPGLSATGNGRVANLSERFVDVATATLGMRFVREGPGDLRTTIGPEDVFDYVYAVFHSPAYRARYAEFLRTDFPRLPLTSNANLFRALAACGAELTALHLLESPKLNHIETDWPVRGGNRIESVRYSETDGRVWINDTQYFGKVPLAVWDFHVGGYQVCHKWLKDRKGRKFADDDVRHYQKIVVALEETIRLMAAIERAIGQHGGGPIR